MSTRAITLPADQWEAILEVVQGHWDEGPPGEGWQGSRLSAAFAALSTALAQPEPEGVTERIASIATAVRECAFGWEPTARLIGNVCAEDVADLCGAILTRHASEAASEVLTDEAIEELTWRHTCEIGDLGVGIAVEDAPAFIRAALARWSRPAIEPVPVAERPWEREGWCDAEGRCWWWCHRHESWELDDGPAHYRHSLPHRALPIPTP
jgi:hypothetical protein